MDLYCQVFSSVELIFPLSITTFFRQMIPNSYFSFSHLKLTVKVEA